MQSTSLTGRLYHFHSKCCYYCLTFEEIKNEEDAKFRALEEKQTKQIQDMEYKLRKIMENVGLVDKSI